MKDPDFSYLDMTPSEAEAMSLDEAMEHARTILFTVQEAYSPVATCGLFSGGNDSTTFMHLLRGHFTHAVHINTGIGVEETRRYVRETTAMFGLPLIEMEPEGDNTYRSLILKYGFPGPAGHPMMYRHLKERQLRRVRKHFIANGRKERVIFAAGMRHFESSRRMRNTETTRREGAIVWCSPLAWWTNDHMAEYRQRYDVPRNEVSANLHMSGECLCGAFAKPDELEQIRFFYPKTAEMIESLEAEAREAGVHAVWGTRPPRAPKKSSGEVGLLCRKCEDNAS